MNALPETHYVYQFFPLRPGGTCPQGMVAAEEGIAGACAKAGKSSGSFSLKTPMGVLCGTSRIIPLSNW